VRAKGVARIVKYLEQVNAHGAFFDACEISDLEALLGCAVENIDSGRRKLEAATRGGAVSDQDYVQYLWCRVVREQELARPAMGALADRHWPALC
jgi:hypothetical protein